MLSFPPLSRRALLSAALMASATLCLPAVAQTFPTKPIRIVVPYPPGGPLDAITRALAEQAKDKLGTIVVENKPGAGGNIGADAVAKSTPDGHTLVVGAVATHAINPSLFPKMPYDPVKDFAPVTLVANVPNVLIVNSDFAKKHRIESVHDLVVYARGNPGKINFASGGNGSAGHLAGELLKAQANVYMVHIPYAGAAPAQLGLLAGQTDLMFDNLASAAARIREGRVKALAVTTLKRAAQFPELPTMSEAGAADGLKGFDINTWFGLFAPAGTPKAVVDHLNRDLTAALRSESMRTRMAGFAADPAPTTPEEFGTLVRNELKKYADVVKRSGAKVD